MKNEEHVKKISLISHPLPASTAMSFDRHCFKPSTIRTRTRRKTVVCVPVLSWTDLKVLYSYNVHKAHAGLPDTYNIESEYY